MEWIAAHRYDIDARALAQAFVGHRDHRRIQDARMSEQVVLHLCGADIEPPADDHVGGASRDAQETEIVHSAQISGP